MAVNRSLGVFPTGLVIVGQGKRAEKQPTRYDQWSHLFAGARTQTTTQQRRPPLKYLVNMDVHSYCATAVSDARQLGLGSASSGLSSSACLQHTFHSLYKPTDVSTDMLCSQIKLLFIGVSLFAEGRFTCYVDKLRVFFNPNFLDCLISLQGVRLLCHADSD